MRKQFKQISPRTTFSEKQREYYTLYNFVFKSILPDLYFIHALRLPLTGNTLSGTIPIRDLPININKTDSAKHTVCVIVIYRKQNLFAFNCHIESPENLSTQIRLRPSRFA